MSATRDKGLQRRAPAGAGVPWIAAVLVPAAVLFVVPAAAVDGEILIDQARVNAGGITPGDAPGFPATLSRPGRYKLTGNLKVPAGQYGIEVTQDEVTIDLNGFTISSNPPGEAVEAVLADGVTGLKVMNGTITGFQGTAIYNFSGKFSSVENMRIISNGGTGVAAGTDSRVRNSTIANNDVGIACASSCLVEQSVIADSAGVGVAAQSGGTAIGNVIAGNNYGLHSVSAPIGYGNNILYGNVVSVSGALQLHTNACDPPCP
jgi:hypothetical protein